MQLLLLGFSFQKTPLEIRERLCFRETQLKSAYQQAKQFGLPNLIILSTCNRIEFYFTFQNSKSNPSEPAVFQKLFQFIADFQQQDIQLLKKYAYTQQKIQVVRHLYTVASSLDSMVIGENQILGQIKEAYSFHKIKDPLLNRLFQSAIAIGKKIRTQTKIGAGGVSIGSLSIDIVKNLFNQNDIFSICLLGSGTIAQECLQSLQKYGNARVVICNRDLKKAKHKLKELQAKWKIKKTQPKQPDYQVVEFANRYEVIAKCDITICSTNAENFVIEKQRLVQELIAKKPKVHLLIDLAVPRNIDPKVNQLKQVIYYSLDDLQQITTENKNKRLAEISLVQEMINKSIKDFLEWQIKTLFLEFFSEQKSILNSNCSRQTPLYLASMNQETLKKNYYALVDQFLKKQNDIALTQFYSDIEACWERVNKMLQKRKHL